MFKNYDDSVVFANVIQKNISELGFHGSDNNLLMLFSHMFLENDVKIFNVDKSIKSVLLNTNNKIFPRKMPYNDIFINVDFNVGLLDIKGIYVHRTTPPKDLVKTHRDRLFVFTWGFDRDDGAPFFSNKNIAFEDDYSELDDLVDLLKVSESELYDDTDMTSIKEYEKIYPLFVCNFLDFLNNPNIEIINKPVDENRNKKRILRNKNPIPEHNILRITGELKKYINDFSKTSTGAKKYTHKYYVRGHVRRYWKKERYSNLYDLFLNKKLSTEYYMDDEYHVLMQWIPPYIKGRGMLISKPYELKGRVDRP